jgi:AcrR family transcriptional regulator
MKKTITRQRLLEATLKLISEKGYLGSTTREIALEAGVTELTLFRHFGTKEKLFEELLNNHTFLPQLRELLPELDRLDYEEGLRLIATSFLLSLKERKSMVKIMYSEVTIYPDKVKALYNQFANDLRTTLASYFKSLQKKRILRKVQPEMAARVFLGMLFAYFRSEEIMRPGGMKKNIMDRQIQEMIDIFARGTLNNAPR